MDHSSRGHGSEDGAADTKPTLQEILSKLAVPAFSELGHVPNCSICNDAFLTGSSPEMPMKLPCGHILGSQCLLKWLSPLSSSGNNTCPFCRVAVLESQFVESPPAESQPVENQPTSESSRDAETEQR